MKADLLEYCSYDYLLNRGICVVQTSAQNLTKCWGNEPVEIILKQSDPWDTLGMRVEEKCGDSNPVARTSYFIALDSTVL